MPAFRDGRWEDLETGISYSAPSKIYIPFVMTDEIKKHREYAKQYGGSALTGTTPQKKWAEKIRYGILSKVDPIVAEILCMFAKDSKNWINMRDTSIKLITERSIGAIAARKELFRIHSEVDALPDRSKMPFAESYEILQQESALLKKCQPHTIALNKFESWKY